MKGFTYSHLKANNAPDPSSATIGLMPRRPVPTGVRHTPAAAVGIARDLAAGRDERQA